MVGRGVKLDDVMDELAARGGKIPGMRPFGYPTDNAQPPALIVGFPAAPLQFDETYGRAADRMTVPVWVLVGKPTDRSSRDMLARYVAGSGSHSVKAALETGEPAAFDSCHVLTVEFDVVELAGTPCLTAKFDVDVVGEGAFQ